MPRCSHTDISQIRKWSQREAAGSHKMLQPGFKPRARDVETKSITLEGRAGERGKKTPYYIKWLGFFKKAGLLGSEPQTWLPSLTSWQGTDLLFSSVLPACVETRPVKKHRPLPASPQLSLAAEAQEGEDRRPGCWAGSAGSPPGPPVPLRGRRSHSFMGTLCCLLACPSSVHRV